MAAYLKTAAFSMETDRMTVQVTENIKIVRTFGSPVLFKGYDSRCVLYYPQGGSGPAGGSHGIK